MSIDDLLYSPVSSSPVPVRAAVIANQNGDLRLPPSWRMVMQALRAYDGQVWQNATLAGGALRDLDLGRPIKDVDIFLPYGTVTSERLEDCLHPYLPEKPYVHETKHDPNSNSALTNGIVCPSHFTFTTDGWRFEITQKMEPFTQTSIIDSFDLGFCMIALDDFTVYRSSHYVQDVANKHIRIVQTTGNREMHHAERLQRQKYGDWCIVL